ncbi:MAG: hypothetical protein AB7L91_08100 [Dehalococcoidia bacterium]
MEGPAEKASMHMPNDRRTGWILGCAYTACLIALAVVFAVSRDASVIALGVTIVIVSVAVYAGVVLGNELKSK